MRILFISRAYPPVTGGLENQNFALSQWLPKLVPTTTIANRLGKKFLPFFLPYATLKALFLMRSYDALLLGDGVLAVVGFFVKLAYPKKATVSVVHGLDLTYQNILYRRLWVDVFLPSLDRLIAVSEETKNAGVRRGLSETLFQIIPNGIETPASDRDFSRHHLERLLGMSLDTTYVLLTTGRLARRKGTVWFIENVLPRLPGNTLYVVAGDGPEKEAVQKAVRRHHLSQRVQLLGYVSDDTRDLLLHTADVFVQPNIRVEGDMEGFGIAVLEAAACGRPVIASRLEGLRDALKNNENGILVEPENPDAFVAAITSLLSDPHRRKDLGARAARYTLQHYHWNSIIHQYLKVLFATVERLR